MNFILAILDLNSSRQSIDYSIGSTVETVAIEAKEQMLRFNSSLASLVWPMPISHA